MLFRSSETQLCKLFIVCHEFAHTYAGHLKDTKKTILRMTKGSKIAKIDLEKYNKNQNMEFEADNIAFEWYKEYMASNHEFSTGTRELLSDGYKYQPILTLYILNWLEVISSKITNNHNEPPTHPRTIDRMQKLANDHWQYFTDKEKVRINEMISEGEKQQEAIDHIFSNGTN